MINATVRRLSRLVATLSVAAMLSAVSAFAQPQPTNTAPDPLPPETGVVNLTPFVGVGFGGKLENTPGAFGIALGYGLSPRIVAEGELYIAPGAEQGIITRFDTSIWSLSANLLYHFVDSAEDFTPYAAAGVGILTGDGDVTTPALPVDDTSTALSWNLGGGVKAAMHPRWGVRADLRYISGRDFAPDHWRLYGGVVIRRLF